MFKENIIYPPLETLQNGVQLPANPFVFFVYLIQIPIGKAFGLFGPVWAIPTILGPLGVTVIVGVKFKTEAADALFVYRPGDPPAAVGIKNA